VGEIGVIEDSIVEEERTGETLWKITSLVMTILSLVRSQTR
jgi:hypothetical protein